jgi:hypothetical protein
MVAACFITLAAFQQQQQGCLPLQNCPSGPPSFPPETSNQKYVSTNKIKNK